MLLTLPNRMPSRQMRPSRQLGHHRRRGAAAWAALRGALRRRHQERDDDDRQAPQRDRDAPVAAAPGQHQRQGQADGENLADQQAVGIGRGGKADAIGQPGAHQRRQGRLHHRDAAAHRDGGGKQHRHVGGRAARRSGERGEEETRDQRPPGPEARDDERARHGRRRKQQRRQPGERADLGLGEIEIGMDQRQERRHRQHRHAQRRAAQPQQAERGQELAQRRGGAMPGRWRHGTTVMVGIFMCTRSISRGISAVIVRQRVRPLAGPTTG